MDKTLISRLGKGVGGYRLAAKFRKKDFFHFFKNVKNPKNLKIDYILADHRVNMPRPGVFL
jgi:hypothetical protein